MQVLEENPIGIFLVVLVERPAERLAVSATNRQVVTDDDRQARAIRCPFVTAIAIPCCGAARPARFGIGPCPVTDT